MRCLGGDESRGRERSGREGSHWMDVVLSAVFILQSCGKCVSLSKLVPNMPAAGSKSVISESRQACSVAVVYKVAGRYQFYMREEKKMENERLVCRCNAARVSQNNLPNQA